MSIYDWTPSLFTSDDQKRRKEAGNTPNNQEMVGSFLFGVAKIPFSPIIQTYRALQYSYDNHGGHKNLEVIVYSVGKNSKKPGFQNDKFNDRIYFDENNPVKYKDDKDGEKTKKILAIKFDGDGVNDGSQLNNFKGHTNKAGYNYNLMNAIFVKSADESKITSVNKVNLFLHLIYDLNNELDTKNFESHEKKIKENLKKFLNLDDQNIESVFKEFNSFKNAIKQNLNKCGISCAKIETNDLETKAITIKNHLKENNNKGEEKTDEDLSLAIPLPFIKFFAKQFQASNIDIKEFDKISGNDRVKKITDTKSFIEKDYTKADNLLDKRYKNLKIRYNHLEELAKKENNLKEQENNTSLPDTTIPNTEQVDMVIKMKNSIKYLVK